MSRFPRKPATCTPRAAAGRLPSGTPDIPVAWALFLVVVAATYYRMYFGVSFADEAYYVAIPLRFVLGDLPFRDDATTLFSMFSFISYPFFKLYRAVNGSSEGIVLFARHLYLGFVLLVAAALYRVARRLVGPAPAILLASCVVAFIPFNIQGVSYNTLAAGLLTAGLFAGAWGCRERLDRYAACSGFLLALCVIAYPPMAVAALAALICMAIQHRRSLVTACLGGVAALVCLAPLLGHAEWETVRSNFAYVRSIGVQGGSSQKLVAVIQESISHLWRGPLLGALLCWALVRSRALKAGAAAALLPLILALTNKFPRHTEPVLSHGFLVALALIGPLLYRGLEREERRFFLAVWIPSAVAALVMGYSSSNGYLNSGIAFLAGAMVSLAMLTVLIGRAGRADSSLGRLLQLLMLASTAAVLVFYQYKSFYSEAPFRKLNTTVASGPYRYLRTTPGKARFIEQLQADVGKAAREAGSIVFYYDFPAGYLISDLQPATNTVWLFAHATYPGVDTAQLEQRYSQPEKRPDVIVRFDYMLSGEDQQRALVHEWQHPIDQLLASGGYRIWATRSQYVLFIKDAKALGRQGRS